MQYNFSLCSLAIVIFLCVEIVSPGSISESVEETGSILSHRGVRSNLVSPSNATIDSPQAGGNASAAESLQNATASGTSKDKGIKAKTIDLSKPGVLKRAALVFGGFGLIAVAYFLFYRRRLARRGNNIAGAKNSMDGMQFQYGFLQSDDQSDRMDHSAMPLTMDSGDETEEDLEIFNRGERKKPASYYNLNSEESKAAIDDIMSSASGSFLQNDELLLDINSGSSPAVMPVNSVNHQV